ncbi:helix-turn-helix domain-containing protein [Roseovarius tibetensis]|uniref:helix-turn-helix domain-containing protein n=1 Tax=Roseovarius tibetensis TaxID=2685897 RepID=UPI003D7F9532
MKPYPTEQSGISESHSENLYDGEIAEEDLWFLPGPTGDEQDYLPPLPRAEADERAQIAAWELAQGEQAAHLAHVSARFGALDERLRRSPEGWRHRLALIEASELSWLTGRRIPTDRLGLWHAMRISAASDDTSTLQRATWAFRRLVGGPGPEPDLAGFLGRREIPGQDLLSEKIATWNAIMSAAGTLHPIVRAGFAFHLWPLSGIGIEGNRLEGAVVAGRMSASDGQGGILFVPMVMGGAGTLRGGGDPAERLRNWLKAAEQGLVRAMRHIDRLECWETTAKDRTARLSGRTPPRLIEVFCSWPLVTAPMAEKLTGASRAAIQRNLAWLEAQGLVKEITGQGRFRVWRAMM